MSIPAIPAAFGAGMAIARCLVASEGRFAGSEMSSVNSARVDNIEGKSVTDKSGDEIGGLRPANSTYVFESAWFTGLGTVRGFVTSLKSGNRLTMTATITVNEGDSQ